MGLADQIAKRNEEHFSQDGNVDEFGIPVPQPETPDYWVARALLRNRPKDPTEIYQIHLRGNDLYLGHRYLNDTEKTFYELTGARRSVKKWELYAFFDILRQKVPVLSRRYLKVTENLLWDIEQARLVREDEL